MSKFAKPLPPSKSNKKPKAVKQKVRRKHKPIIALPPFPPYIYDEKNPLIGNKHAKRPLVIALAKIIPDNDDLMEAVRLSGSLYVVGSSSTHIDETPIKRNEWSGSGYALRTGRKWQNTYEHQAKLDLCMPFAKALYKCMKNEEMDSERSKGIEKWTQVKQEIEK